MKYKVISVGIIAIVASFIFLVDKEATAYSENLSEPLNETINAINSGQLQYDTDDNGTIDIIDVANRANNLGYIDVSYLKDNYVSIISDKDKRDYEEIDHEIISQNCFPVTSEGIDLFEYVSAASGMTLEVIEGDNSFKVENDKLYLVGEAPAIAKVRLINAYAKSEEFFIYGTNDRELHDYTYDYLLKLANN